MIKQTQDQWMNSDYFASSNEGGLGFPDFCKVVESFGIKSLRITKNEEIKEILKKFINSKESIFLDVKITPNSRVIPQVKFGRPNEDTDPLLSRDKFFQEMIVKPYEVSLKK